eukprot:6466068-Amphidinium_carterae.1
MEHEAMIETVQQHLQENSQGIAQRDAGSSGNNKIILGLHLLPEFDISENSSLLLREIDLQDLFWVRDWSRELTLRPEARIIPLDQFPTGLLHLPYHSG